jgi:hypothetical protein
MALPAESQMTALSMLPGPTRLRMDQYRLYERSREAYLVSMYARAPSVLHPRRVDGVCSPCQDMTEGLCGRRELVEG